MLLFTLSCKSYLDLLHETFFVASNIFSTFCMRFMLKLLCQDNLSKTYACDFINTFPKFLLQPLASFLRLFFFISGGYVPLDKLLQIKEEVVIRIVVSRKVYADRIVSPPSPIEKISYNLPCNSAYINILRLIYIPFFDRVRECSCAPL